MESGGLILGQISGVAVGTGDADVYIFHRGSRVWNKDSFDALNNFQNRNLGEGGGGPIREKTLVQLNASSGDVIRQWADGMYVQGIITSLFLYLGCYLSHLLHTGSKHECGALA